MAWGKILTTQNFILMNQSGNMKTWQTTALWGQGRSGRFLV